MIPVFPRAMMEYFPSKGDRPPPRFAFPPPAPVIDPEPPEVGTSSLKRPWILDPSLSMRDRCESMKFPHQDGKDGTVGKIDQVPVNFAINGLKITWLSAPPMSKRDNPPASVVTSLSKSLMLLPLVE